MRTEREFMREILEAALIESIKSPTYSQLFFKDEHDILVHQGVICYGKPNEKCERIFNPWEIEEVLDCFLGHDEDENYELEAKDDQEQSELTQAVEEAKRGAKIEILTKLRMCYIDSYNEYAEAKDDNYRSVIGMAIYRTCIQNIEKMLEELN